MADNSSGSGESNEAAESESPVIGPGGAGEAAGPAEAAELLSEVRRLRRSARSARHAYWFPLVLFGVLTVVAMPLYLVPVGVLPAHSHASRLSFLPLLGGRPGFINQDYLGYYWLVALLVGLVLTLAWYRHHARQIGLRTPARGYLITVVVVTVLAVVVPILSRVAGLRWLIWVWAIPGIFSFNGTFPFMIIAAGLWALSWAERSRALAVIALVYTGSAVLVALYNVENVLFRIGWNPWPDRYHLTTLPSVALPALVLLIAGAVSFAVQRRQRRAP